MQAPLLTCYAVSFEEKISSVILRDVNTVQNASEKSREAEKRKARKAEKQKSGEAGKAKKKKSKKAEKQRNRKSRKAKQQKSREAESNGRCNKKDGKKKTHPEKI